MGGRWDWVCGCAGAWMNAGPGSETWVAVSAWDAAAGETGDGQDGAGEDEGD